MFFCVCFLAYSHVSEALLGVVEHGGDEHAEAAQPHLAVLLRELPQFAKMFPFARPRALLVAGLADCLAARTRPEARRRGRESLAAAIAEGRRLDMPLEEAWARFLVQRFADVPDFVRRLFFEMRELITRYALG